MINFLQRVEARVLSPGTRRTWSGKLRWPTRTWSGRWTSRTVEGASSPEAEVITSLVVEGRRAADVARKRVST
jgi:hypothetical protein